MLATIDDPDKQQARDEFERKHGLTSIVDIARRDKWPNSTRSETIELILRNVEEDNLLRTLLAERGVAGDAPLGQPDPEPPAPGESDDEIRGRENGPDGPKARDGEAPEPSRPEPATEQAADAALNGAQVAALLAIIERIALGEMPKSTAAQIMVAAFPAAIPDIAAAMRIVAPVKEGSTRPTSGGPGVG